MIPTLAVIAKECVPGKAKTRMTPPLTPEQAARVAQSSLSHTLDTVRQVQGIRRRLVFDGTPDPTDAEDFEVVAQSEGGLDERLAAICDGTRGPLLILGMDTPQVTAEQLDNLIREFPRHQAWFGPAADGGFWALGLREPDGGLIRGVPMSRPDTGSRQLARLQRAGLGIGMLPVLTDVDTFELAVEVAQSMDTGPFPALVEEIQRELHSVAAAATMRGATA